MLSSALCTRCSTSLCIPLYTLIYTLMYLTYTLGCIPLLFHSFCPFSKETKLLFDELNFCLQRLYSIPFHVDMPFNDSILEEITTAEASSIVIFLERALPFSLFLHRNPNRKAFLSLQEPGALCQLCLLHSNNSYQEENENTTK